MRTDRARIVRSSRPPSLVEDTRSARWAWLQSSLLFGPVVLPTASASSFADGVATDTVSSRDGPLARDTAAVSFAEACTLALAGPR